MVYYINGGECFHYPLKSTETLFLFYLLLLYKTKVRGTEFYMLVFIKVIDRLYTNLEFGELSNGQNMVSQLYKRP